MGWLRWMLFGLGHEGGGEEPGEFVLRDGRVVQTKTVMVQDAPDPPGRVMMEEEVFATWAATALIIALMGTQFTSRKGIKDNVRVPLDIFTMALSLLVLVWAALSYFGVIPKKLRPVILIIAILAICALILLVIVLVSQKKI